MYCILIRIWQAGKPNFNSKHGNHENDSFLFRLYEQMYEPKYVIAMGAYAITAGMFSINSYSTIRG